MLDQISNEIQDYFVNELRVLNNFASRLEKLLKLVDGSKAYMKALTDAALLTQVFNIFEITPKLSYICEPF